MKIEVPRYAAANVERVNRQIQEVIVAGTPEPTIEEMVAWCDDEADRRAATTSFIADFAAESDVARHQSDIAMLRAIAALLRQTEGGR